MLWKVPPIWKDDRCFIIGGGPSIPVEFGVPEKVINSVYSGNDTPKAYSPYMEAIHKEHVIAVNMAFKIGDWMDILFWGDNGFFKRDPNGILGFPGLRVSIATDTHAPALRIRKVKRDDALGGISFDPAKIRWNTNSGAAAINLAVLLGAKEIYLLGFDMHLNNENQQHWHNFYGYGTNGKTSGHRIGMHLKSFPRIADDLRGTDIEIINIGKGSAITNFPKVSFKDLKL